VLSDLNNPVSLYKTHSTICMDDDDDLEDIGRRELAGGGLEFHELAAPRLVQGIVFEHTN
jgi:hypothetical protein